MMANRPQLFPPGRCSCTFTKFSMIRLAGESVIDFATLKKFNIKIPQEIAVVGFSNSTHSTIIEPNLTTIDQPGKRMGRIAVQQLVNEIEDPIDLMTSKSIEIKTNLIIRESTFGS